MNRKPSISRTINVCGFVLSALYIAYSFIGTFFNLPNFGKLNNTTGILVGFIVFAINASWKFWNMEQEINTLKSKHPKVLFSEPKCVEITSEQIDLYGRKSLLGSLISCRQFYMFCIDFFNKPTVPSGQDAIDAQVLIEFYDKDDERKTHYLGRWIDKPEIGFGVKHEKKNIMCNSANGEILGIAIIENKGDDLFLLDSGVVDNRSDGSIWNPPHLLAGKYTLIVTIFGKNFPKISKVYDVQNLRDERLVFAEKKDGVRWLKKVENDRRKLSRIWSSMA